MSAALGARVCSRVLTQYRDGGDVQGRDYLLARAHDLVENMSAELVEGMLCCLCEKRVPCSDKVAVVELIKSWCDDDDGVGAVDMRQDTTDEKEADGLRGELQLRGAQCSAACESFMQHMPEFAWCDGRCSSATAVVAVGTGPDLSGLLLMAEEMEKGAGDKEQRAGVDAGAGVAGETDVVARACWYALQSCGTRVVAREMGLGICCDMIGRASRLVNLGVGPYLQKGLSELMRDADSFPEKIRYQAACSVMDASGGSATGIKLTANGLRDVVRHRDAVLEERWVRLPMRAVNLLCRLCEHHDDNSTTASSSGQVMVASAARLVTACVEDLTRDAIFQKDENQMGDALDALLTYAKWKKDEEGEESVRRRISDLGCAWRGIYGFSQNVHEKSMEKSFRQNVDKLLQWSTPDNTQSWATVKTQLLEMDVGVAHSLRELEEERGYVLGGKNVEVVRLVCMVMGRLAQEDAATAKKDGAGTRAARSLLVESLISSSDTCASGHSLRIVNALSGVSGFALTISCETEIYAKMQHVLRKRIQERSADAQSVLLGQLEMLAKGRSIIDDSHAELRELYMSVIGSKELEQMRREYIGKEDPDDPDDPLMSASEYGEAFRTAMMRYEGLLQ